MSDQPPIKDAEFGDRFKPCEKHQEDGNANAILSVVDSLEKDFELTEIQKATCHDWRGCAVLIEEQFEEAQQHVETAIGIASKLESIEHLAKFTLHLALIHEESGDDQNAIIQFEKAAETHEKVKDPEGQRECLKYMGDIHRRTGEHIKSLSAYERILEIDRKSGHQKNESESLSRIGGSYWYMKDFDKAMEIYNEALAISRSIGNKRGEFREFHNIGLIHQSREMWQEAQEAMEKGLAIVEELNDEHGISACSMSLGIILDKQDKYEEGKPYLIRGLELSQKIGHWLRESLSYLNLGISDVNLGDLQEGEKHIDLSIAGMEELAMDGSYEYGIALATKSRLEGKKGNTELETDYANDAMACAKAYAEKIGDTEGECEKEMVEWLEKVKGLVERAK